MQQSPHINGVYYDGINFSRLSMVADAAAAASNSSFAPLLDLHSGRDPTPPAASYAGESGLHYDSTVLPAFSKCDSRYDPTVRPMEPL